VKLLLDTHIWIWAVTQPRKLAAKVRRELQRESNELYLSPVSIWEARYLDRRKRFRAKPDFPQWLDKSLSQVPLREAPFTFAIATTASQIELPEPDPGDVFWQQPL
jgi:PIN domain nuclease of toxin-antitoxin system